VIEGRYSRQTLLPEIGLEGQKKLERARAVVIGCGALGTHSLSLLARAGVGHIKVVDRDVVDITNLQRQTLFDEGDIGRPKAVVAEERLKRINSSVEVMGVVKDVNPGTIETLVKGATVVIDATDNMETRFLINDFCVKHDIPWVYGGAVGVDGMVLVVTREGPCLRCAFRSVPHPGELPTCDTAGIANTLPSIVASVQVTEAYKIMMGSMPAQELIVLDTWTHDLQKIKVLKNPDCPCCGLRKFDFLTERKDTPSVSLCGRTAVQISPSKHSAMDLRALESRLREQGKVVLADDVLRFEGQDARFVVFPDGRAVISGVTDPGEGLAIYSRYIGD